MTLNRTTSRSRIELEKAHIHEAKTSWNLNKMYWLLGSESQLSIENKLYKAIFKPIWSL